MKIRRIGNNETEVETSRGDRVFFSYNTPVAMYRLGHGYFRTDKFFSVTTSKHINKWLDGAEAKKISQEELEKDLGPIPTIS